MGLPIRDERQMKTWTGWSPAQCDHLLPVCSAIYRGTPQQTYAEGGPSGTHRRHPGGGAKETRPTMAEPLPLVFSYEKTSPPLAVLGTRWAMARSEAHENLPQLAPILYDTLVHRELRPHRELATPEE